MRLSLVIFLCAFTFEVKCTNILERSFGKEPSIEDESPKLETDILNWLQSFVSDTKITNPTASCSYGRFQGTYNTTRLGRTFESYRGIPYAEAPVGSMRFQPPKLIQYYRGMVNATKDGKICPQLSSENNTFAFDDMDEDCLFVNVYTPQRSDRKRLLPVFVYIHQSAFYFKNSRSDLYGPDYLLDRDIVFVTFNYRLGTLGYLSTGDELAPGNNGFKDMVTLLKWVKRYIVAFGGNPGSVTVGGYSSGAISIVSLMVSPMAKGLFHRAIAMGGSSTRNNETKTDLYDLAVKQAEIFNCPTENSKVIVECLKEKPWIDYAKTFSQFWAFTNNPSHLWEPIVEKDFGQERFLTMNTIESIRQGKMMNIPLIIGQGTAEEYPFAYPILNNETLLKMANERWDEFASIAFFLPEQNRMKALEVLRTYYIKNEILNNDDESADRLGTIYGDDSTAFPVERLSKLLSIHSRKPVYYYYFTYVGNHSYTEEFSANKPTQATHQDETLYFLSQPHIFPNIGKEGDDARMVNIMTGIIYNFASYGNPIKRTYNTPELKGVTWPAMKANDRTYLQIDKTFSVGQNLKEERLQIWENLYPINYN